MGQTYHVSQKLLHWLHALLILLLIPSGLAMTRMGEGALTNVLYEGHKSFGILVFCLVIVRITLRIIKGAPAYGASMNPLLIRAARIGQGVIYGLVLVVPVLGYAATSMCCKPVALFGLWSVPLEISGSETLMKQLFFWHETGALVLTALVAGHIMMAIYHRWIARDGLFERML